MPNRIANAASAGVRGTTTPPARPDLRSLYGTARMSPQRALIAEAVSALPGAFTAEELHCSVAGTAPGVGLATVYRALAAMQAAGSITPVGERGGSALLAHCDRRDHHHHLVCTECGAVVAIDCPLGAEALASAEHAGHLVTRHEITLYGLCAGCRAKRESA